MKALRFLPLLVLLAACDAAVLTGSELRAADLSLTTDARAYDSGDVVALALHNGGDTSGDAGFLGCTPLEREAGAGWETSPDGNDRVCPGVVIPLEPGETAMAQVPLDGVSAGTYRFALGVADGTVTTAAFEVR